MAMPPHRPLREFLRRIALWRGKRAILRIVKPYCAKATTLATFAPRFDPPRLALYIRTLSDAERDRLRADEAKVLPEFRRALVASGYPAGGAECAWFAFESQETIDRDYGCSWYQATK